MNTAFINGVSSHIFDYDDTHLKTIIHPAGPVVSAILANAVYPDHYDRGWHITGTAGVFGAAASM
jgi:2-methylcitrate dehydratase PrpD